MNPLELKRKKVEIVRVGAAKAEMEFQIEEKLDEIERIKRNIENQEKRISQLQDEINKGE